MRNLVVTLLIALGLLSACSESGPSTEAHLAPDTSATPIQRPTALKGAARFKCWEAPNYAEHSVALHTTSSDPIWATLGDCSTTLGFEIEYSGEIDSSFEQLMSTVNDEILQQSNRDRFRGVGLQLRIDSPGGDVEAAMRIGDLIGKYRWRVIVASSARCASACIFVFAAAAERVPAGSIEIHRIRAVNSVASSPEEMGVELKQTIADAREYMTRHGASSAVVDRMMTIASSESVSLSKDELRLYGLWLQNAAQQDIDYNALIQVCGEVFAERLVDARKSWPTACISDDSSTQSDEEINECKRQHLLVTAADSPCNDKDERFLPQTF